MENPAAAKETPAIITWGRGNYSVRTRQWRYNEYFDKTTELYHNSSDPHEWFNLSNITDFELIKKKLAAWIPVTEAPLVIKGKALHNVVDADKPDLEKAKAAWIRMNQKIKPPLEGTH